MQKRTTVSLDTKVSSKNHHMVYARMLMCYFDSIQHLFTPDQIGLIRGTLRRGDLTATALPCVELRLTLARETGNLTVTDFRQLYQFYSLLRKLPLKGNDLLCKKVGYAKLLAGEDSCKVTNMTIDSRISCEYDLFDRVKRIIEKILGRVPNNFLDTEVFFGPGSTVNLNSRTFEETSTFFKITDRLIVPERAKFYLAAHLSYNPNWVDMLASHYQINFLNGENRLEQEMRVFNKHFEVVSNDYPSNIGFVPKNSDEHRAIGIEMNGLIPLQKIVGDMIRKKLQRVGINLDSQQRNRHLARLAKTFDLATIDLANASSSISLELVRALLPPEWFALISDFRSTHGQCKSIPDSDVIEYEMVSSMGNGFTFELESLIFYALAKATCEKDGISSLEIKRSVSVYGDDIIVPQRAASQLMRNMTLFGFTANVEKSFTEGFFFESCGSDYYDGVDVRPFFLKREINTLRDLFFLMNSLLFKGIQQQRADLVDLYCFCFKMLPKDCPLGPLHFETEKTGYRLSTDDLEAVLRVPLEFAQSNGGVRFEPSLHAWAYKKWVRVAIEVPLSKNNQYAVRHARYMTFLKGNLSGKAVLRGRCKSALCKDTTSRWDGALTFHELSVVSQYFAGI